MHIKKFNWLMAPEDDGFGGGSGGGVEVADDLESNGSGETEVETDESGGEEEEESGGSGSGTPELNYDAMGDAIGRAIAGRLPQPTQVEQPFDLDAFRAQTGYPKIDDALATQLFNPEATPTQRAQILASVVDGLTKHVFKVVQTINQQRDQTREAALTPVREFVRQQHVSNLATMVTKAHPALAQKSPIVRRVIEGLRAQGYRPANEKDAVRVVASMTESAIKEVDPTFSLSAQQRQQSRNMPGMAGHMQGGGGAGGSKTKAGWQAIFE